MFNHFKIRFAYRLRGSKGVCMPPLDRNGQRQPCAYLTVPARNLTEALRKAKANRQLDAQAAAHLGVKCSPVVWPA